MEEYLVCVHAYCESSLESLKEATAGNDLGILLYAAKVTGPTYNELQEIVQRSWIAANRPSVPKFNGFNLHPFIERVEINEGIIEYHASQVDVFSLDAAHKLWSKVDIASACVAFDRWLKSDDTALEKPVQRECEMLHRIVAESAAIASSAGIPEPSKKAIAYMPRTDDEIKKNVADRQLAFDAACEILVTAALEGKPIPSSSAIAKQVVQKGILDISEKTFRNVLCGNAIWKSLMILVKKRPAGKECREYQQWRERFDEVLPFLRRELVQRSDAGISDEERAVSFKKLARFVEKKKKPAKRKRATAKKTPRKKSSE